MAAPIEGNVIYGKACEKIAPSRIAFDIDGVLADTMGLFLEIARMEYAIEHIRHQDITEYFLEDCLDIDPEVIKDIINRILDGAFEPELKPIDGAVQVLTDIGKVHPLLFVTARPEASTIREWVHRILPLEPSRIEVIATGTFEGKAEVLDARGIRFFVEDYFYICELLNQQGITPILFRQPWNRFPDHPFKEVGSWAEIADMVDLHSD